MMIKHNNIMMFFYLFFLVFSLQELLLHGGTHEEELVFKNPDNIRDHWKTNMLNYGKEQERLGNPENISLSCLKGLQNCFFERKEEKNKWQIIAEEEANIRGIAYNKETGEGDARESTGGVIAQIASAPEQLVDLNEINLLLSAPDEEDQNSEDKQYDEHGELIVSEAPQAKAVDPRKLSEIAIARAKETNGGELSVQTMNYIESLETMESVGTGALVKSEALPFRNFTELVERAEEHAVSHNFFFLCP